MLPDLVDFEGDDAEFEIFEFPWQAVASLDMEDSDA